MARTVRKTITFPIFDEDVTIDIDWRIVEAAERAYRDAGDRIVNADNIAISLGTPAGMSRSRIADVLIEWMRLQQVMPEGRKRVEVREHIVTARPERLNRYAGCIQGAILYALSYIDERQLRILERGEDLSDMPDESSEPADGEVEDDEGQEKKADTAESTAPDS
ncbi:MAG: hypothetical protein LOD94_04730 [Gammaproteobacteria bacterium]|nr:hypothetical protein [Gammaproteobacteria bacterium]